MLRAIQDRSAQLRSLSHEGTTFTFEEVLGRNAFVVSRRRGWPIDRHEAGGGSFGCETGSRVESGSVLPAKVG
jgi:hypothetical protein